MFLIAISSLKQHGYEQCAGSIIGRRGLRVASVAALNFRVEGLATDFAWRRVSSHAYNFYFWVRPSQCRGSLADIVREPPDVCFTPEADIAEIRQQSTKGQDRGGFILERGNKYSGLKSL